MAYYDFVSNAHGEPSAKRIARSTTLYVTNTVNPLTAGNVDSEYITNNSGVLKFKKACKILIHYELTSVDYSQWVKMELYLNNSLLGSTIEASNGQYKNGSFIREVSKDDTFYGKAWPYDGGGGSIPRYTIYVLTEE